MSDKEGSISGIEKNEDPLCIRIVVEGRVQKTGYRNWLKSLCVSKGVTGWVRNKTNETVEAFLCGNEKSLRDVITQCYQGPTFANVKKVKEYPDKNAENIPVDFVILSA